MRHTTVLLIGVTCIIMASVSCKKVEEPYLNVNAPQTIQISDAGESEQFSISTNRDWSASSNESWCKVTPSSGKSGNEPISILVTCEANTTYNSRSCTVVVNAAGLNGSVTINQDANLGLSVSTDNFSLSNEAQTIEVTVNANVAYSISIDSSAKDWISQVSTKSLTSDKLAFNISANEGYDSREGKIYISSCDPSLSKTETIIVKQGQTDAILVSTPEYEISNESHELSIEVESNVEFDVIPKVDWIHYVPTKALSYSSISLSIDKNETYDKRVGTVKFIQRNGEKSSVVTITQGEKLGLFISPESFDISKDAQTISVEVKHNVDFDVIIPNSGQSWITLYNQPSTRSLSSQTISFNVSENTDYSSRETVITVKQKDGTLAGTLNVLQAQTDVIIPEQTEISASALGGQFKINYTANVTVSCESSCDWLEIDAVNGSSNSIDLTIMANTGNNRETSMLLYGGDAKATITIKQDKLKDGEYLSVDYGRLSESMTNIQQDTITTATIYGKINEDDFQTLNLLPRLKTLDLSNATCLDNTIPTNAFKDNETLTVIIFPNDVEIIGESAFRNCQQLKLPVFPQSLTTIWPYAFYGDSRMSGQLNLPSNLRYISDYAFSSCTGLTGDLAFPNSVEWIGKYAFNSCNGLDGQLSFPTENRLSIGSYAFNACRNFTGDLILSSNISQGSYAFNQAGFTGSVYSFGTGWYTFYSCSIGENLIISDDINNLSHSFREVKVGGYIYIGKNVVSLDSQTFYGASCNTIYIAASTPPVCNSDTSISLYGRYLGVPKGSKNAYENAEYWKNAKIIEEVDFSALKLKP